jgi:hypothetical protein
MPQHVRVLGLGSLYLFAERVPLSIAGNMRNPESFVLLALGTAGHPGGTAFLGSGAGRNWPSSFAGNRLRQSQTFSYGFNAAPSSLPTQA